jgi:hypothetical protein
MKTGRRFRRPEVAHKEWVWDILGLTEGGLNNNMLSKGERSMTVYIWEQLSENSSPKHTALLLGDPRLR